jgi:hypothetical protein
VSEAIEHDDDFDDEQIFNIEGERMKEHYDFSKGVRGKFYNANAVFELPVYLDEQVQGYLAAKAQAKGIDLSALVNDLLKREIELVEAMG